jgi:hypothetical protein
MRIDIKKPLYENFVNIRKSLVLEAIKSNEALIITIPQGTATVSPKWWLDTGKETSQVFKYPDNPMKLIGNYVPHKTEEEKMKEVALSTM